MKNGTILLMAGFFIFLTVTMPGWKQKAWSTTKGELIVGWED